MASWGWVSVLRPYSSRLLTTPSDLAPMSTSISSLSMRTTVPSTTSPCLRLRISPSCSLSSSSIVVGSGRVSTTGSDSSSAAGADSRSSADSPVTGSSTTRAPATAATGSAATAARGSAATAAGSSATGSSATGSSATGSGATAATGWASSTDATASSVTSGALAGCAIASSLTDASLVGDVDGLRRGLVIGDGRRGRRACRPRPAAVRSSECFSSDGEAPAPGTTEPGPHARASCFGWCRPRGSWARHSSAPGRARLSFLRAVPLAYDGGAR